MDEIKTYDDFLEYCSMIADEQINNPSMSGYRYGIREDVQGSEYVIWDRRVMSVLRVLSTNTILDYEEELKLEGMQSNSFMTWAREIVTKALYANSIEKYIEMRKELTGESNAK